MLAVAIFRYDGGGWLLVRAMNSGSRIDGGEAKLVIQYSGPPLINMGTSNYRKGFIKGLGLLGFRS